MSDDVFGEAPDLERQADGVKVIWPLRAVNEIEGELNGFLGEAESMVSWRAPFVWIEDDEWKNAAEYAALYGPLTLREAIAMQGIVYGDVQERFRRQLIVARECGPAATMDDFLLACGAEGIDPILKRNTI